MQKVFDELSISLATSDQMRAWSFGEVKKPETINYRTLKPEKDGLFDERIFGPTKDWECSCGRYKRIRYRGIVCERCGVEVTRREVRRERLGHIELAAPVTHIWYFKGVPSRLGYFLDMSPKELEKVIYFAAYLVVSVDEKKRTKDLSEIEEAVVAEIEIVDEEFADWEKKRVKLMKTEIKTMEDAKIPNAEVQLRKKEIEREIKQRQSKSNAEIKVIQNAFDTLKTLKPKTLIENDTLWREMMDKYEDYFSGGMGAEAVREMISLVNLVDEMKKLESDLDSKSAQRRQRAIQRMKVIKPFSEGKNPPEAMVLEVIPVIPPELRPMVQLDGGRFATSDLNDLYRRLINRNNRLKKLIELGAPDIIISNEKRMLQESVDALFDNGRRGRAVAGAGGRGLKSLSDMLKGKQGRFRQNLLGKRVDYSARSVIVVGPHLELQQCGLPKMMALELFKPFVMKRLTELGLAQNIKSAKRMVERSRAQVWDVLAEIIQEHPVLLNRAPTLHRLGIQAFEPILVEGKAIQVHPLVCEAFNADFDGDQMAVHVPLSSEAQAEARVLMMSTNNVLSPASGHPIVSPSQDMVIGLYYVTECHEKLEGATRAFTDLEEAEIAYENGEITLQTPVKVRVKDLAGDPELHNELKNRFKDLLTDEPVDGTKLISTTMGRMYFNSVMPKDFPYIQSTIRKPEMRKLISEVIERYNKAEVREFLDAMKKVGFKFGTKAGLTVSINDVKTPPTKDEIIDRYEAEAEKVLDLFNKDVITDVERKQKIIEIWNEATEEVQDAMNKELQSSLFNPVDMMVRSGARGNMMQVRQLAGMRGLVANPKGDIIESPIKSNFREGMSVLEYFISTHGARKGLADTALRTADSGYLTRRLVDVAAGIVIKDLGKDNIDWKGTSKPVIVDGKVNRYLYSSIYGRVLAEDLKVDGKIVKGTDGEKLSKGTFIGAEVLEVIASSGVEEVKVLSPFNSKDPESMDPMCYGYSLATGKPVEVGEAVGIISAQSIGEPGTQLTMRTFHTGGVVGLDITSGLPRIVELFEARTPKGKSVLAPIEGTIKSITSQDDGNRIVEVLGDQELFEILVLRRQTLLVNQGDKLKAGQALTTGPKDPKEVLAISGVKACQEYLVNEVQKTYRDQGVEVHDKHVEMIVRQMLRRVRIVKPNDSNFLPNELVDTTQFRNSNQELVKGGKVPAEGRPELMGITKASLATDSWLSAASFQETTRVLTEAAMMKRSDYLTGLKENVIIGTLIPAGTGAADYQIMQPTLPEAPQVSDLGFMSENEEIEIDEEESLPNPAQWLAMLGDEKNEKEPEEEPINADEEEPINADEEEA
jgi:DNA-directed RNA polymerase subunit beta'